MQKEASAQILDLPILKHFNKGEISFDPKSWRKGEKGLARIIALAAAGAIGYFSWLYILPPLFKMLGQTIAIAGTGILLVGLVMMVPVILKGLRRLTRGVHKSLIRYDPFGELEEQKAKMVKNRQVFKASKAKIKALKSNMELEASKSEIEAKKYQTQIVSLKRQSDKLRDQMQEIVSTKGNAGKDTDEYVNLHSSLAKKLSEYQRMANQLEQSKNFIQKYGSRANVMGKMDRKLTLAGTAIDIKISDFETTISMLQKEFDFAKSAKAATDGAKSALHFTKDWELEYALEVVTSTIALDIAQTQENLLDIDSLTSKYSVDSDELYAQLDNLADKINTGDDIIPDSKKYQSPNYKLSSDDKLKSGGFGDMFD